MVRQQWNIGIERLADALAIIPGLHIGQGFQVSLDTIGNFEQRIGALSHGGLTPGIGGGMGGIQRPVQVSRRRARHFTIDLACYRGNVFKVVAFQWGDPLAADKVVVAGIEVVQGIGRAGHGVEHGNSSSMGFICYTL